MKYKMIFLVLTLFIYSQLAFAHVTINYPTGSLEFEIGEQITIEWSVRQYHGPGTWTLEHTLDNGVNWITIKEGIVQSRSSYKWNIPNTPTEMGGIKIIQVNSNDNDYSAFSLNLKFRTVTDISEDNFIQPKNYELYNAYPNPFNNSIVISYYLPQKSNVKLIVYDINGNQIDVLENRTRAVGKHELNWIAKGVASGTYIILLKSNNSFSSKKIVLLK